jgi:effector-binding domain-containing protein
MPDQPQLERREAQPYVALARTVTMDSLASAVDQGFPEILRWLATHGAQPAAAPFIRYASVDPEGALEIELGVPVAADVTGDDHVRAGTLPAGEYVTLLHTGRYDGLVAANAALQDWGREHGVTWARDGDARWCARVEHYLTNPAEVPDPDKWQTLLAYLTVGD